MVITSKQVLFLFLQEITERKTWSSHFWALKGNAIRSSSPFFQRPLGIVPKSSAVKSEKPTTSWLPVNMPTPLSSVYHSSHWELKSISSSLESRLRMSNGSDNSQVRFLSSGPLAITFHLGTQLSHRKSTLFLPEMVDAWKDRPWGRGDPSTKEST